MSGSLLASAGRLGLSLSHVICVGDSPQSGALPTKWSSTTLSLRRAIAQFPPRNIWRENQLDECAQLTKKRVKSGITDAFKRETPPYGGAIEIKDRAEISAETSDVFDRRRRGRGMILLDSAPSMENL